MTDPVLNQVAQTASDHGLILMGACHGAADEGGTFALLGTGPGFWPIFLNAPEYRDGGADPLDRWSKRILVGLAQPHGATCHFPSDGPPYPPFIRWALDTGRFHTSPVGMMVHDEAGLMISLRGALHFGAQLTLPPVMGRSPCETCDGQPCKTACPVGALGGDAYDVAACHGYLDTPDGTACMSTGCHARRVCPVSARFGRDPAQSAFHMAAFHR